MELFRSSGMDVVSHPMGIRWTVTGGHNSSNNYRIVVAAVADAPVPAAVRDVAPRSQPTHHPVGFVRLQVAMNEHESLRDLLAQPQLL